MSQLVLPACPAGDTGCPSALEGDARRADGATSCGEHRAGPRTGSGWATKDPQQPVSLHAGGQEPLTAAGMPAERSH